MSEKYIRQNKNSCLVVKNSKTYAKIAGLEDAIFIRDFLIENDWDLSKTPEVIKKDDNYCVLTVYEDKIYLLAKYRKMPGEKTVSKLIKKHERNPNNSRYGLNITRIFDTFVIKKQIAGDDYIFGYYDNLEDAEFVRNFLLDNDWDVSRFEDISYCEDTGEYKVVKVIDDMVYVLDSFYSDNIDLERCLEEFLTKIYKHKNGLANYPHLDLLKDKIPQLEDDFNVKVRDDYWDLGNGDGDALNQIIFTLTPLQQSIYDSIGESASFEDIKKALIRYKTKNFDEKLNRNLEDLIDKKLVVRDGDLYKKVKE
ncbi:hypothetical protein [uncultured Methanobrevibacter sp.]|uniref:hypothetical protein n=1 Tax=uncultured Methanobrevibacter sp. TaxID=253161 RepID=UPI0025E55E1E|nr:hypothetical protein [uncultured Methanobrevibacter sp.]